MEGVANTMWEWLHYTHLTPSERTRLNLTELYVDSAASVVSTGTAANSGKTAGFASWTAWSLTEILFRRGDLLSRVFALSSFLPIVVVIFLSGLASAPSPQRRQPALALLMFLILNVALNVALKATLRSPRPVHPATLPVHITSTADRTRISYSTQHGMPSDHAQFMTFFVCYLILQGSRVAAPRRPQKKGARVTSAPTPSNPKAAPITTCQVLVFILIDLVVCVGRVYNSYHTVAQVLVGALLGAVMALLCVQPRSQRWMRALTGTLITPVMLLCTNWTAFVA